jgi:cytochrome P450
MIDEPESIAQTPIFTARTIEDPYPVYRRLREEARFYRVPSTGRLLLTHYADVFAALRDPRLSSGRLAETSIPIPNLARPLMRPVVRLLSRTMLFSDPPDHTRLRGLANRAFTPRVVEAMRERVQQVTDELLDAVDRPGPVDLVGTFAAWLPVIVIAELLGLEVRDRERVRRWSDDLVLFRGGSTQPAPLVLTRAARSVFQLQRYLRGAVRQRRSPRGHPPGEDLLTALIAAEERGDTLTEDELLANALLLLGAGHETTTDVIGNGMLALLQRPDEMDRLRREPALIESAVEELLRFDGPVQWIGRVAREDLELNGTPVRAGHSVGVSPAAANRDPAQFADPDRLDIGRPENRHLAFGQGIHFCLGAALARLEGQVAIGTLLERFPDLRLADRPLEWRPSFSLRGLKALWVVAR